MPYENELAHLFVVDKPDKEIPEELQDQPRFTTHGGQIVRLQYRVLHHQNTRETVVIKQRTAILINEEQSAFRSVCGSLSHDKKSIQMANATFFNSQKTQGMQ